MQRFYYPHPLPKEIVLADPEIVHQVSRVLRARVGDEIALFGGDGTDRIYSVVAFGKRDISLKLEGSVEKNGKKGPEIALYQALPNKLEKIEYLLQKGVEVSIDRFVFFPSERSQPLHGLAKKEDRLRMIAKEALEQCGGDALPEIRFENAFPPLPGEGYFFDTGSAPALLEKLGENPDPKEISLFVWPEGGWSKKETDAFRQAGIVPVSLGDRILRTETAWVAGAFLVRHYFFVKS